MNATAINSETARSRSKLNDVSFGVDMITGGDARLKQACHRLVGEKKSCAAVMMHLDAHIGFL